MKAQTIIQNVGLERGGTMSLSASVLNPSRQNIIMTADTRKAATTMRKDSLRNWNTSCHLADPTDLRTPTSRALLSDLAVLRFTKLIHASSNTNKPTAPNSHTIVIRPAAGLPSRNSE